MIAILNYGVGNVKAFANILKSLGVEHGIAQSEQELRSANKIILPGVGSFDSVMRRLADSGLQEVLSDLVLAKKIPVLGVCVGMQILGSKSEEGTLPGLGWIDAEVRKFHSTRLSIPQIGWNEVRNKNHSKLLQGLDADARFYFLHSYYMECKNSQDILAETDYGDIFASAVGRENIFGVQFHPEKSHHNGVRLLKNFSEI